TLRSSLEQQFAELEESVRPLSDSADGQHFNTRAFGGNGASPPPPPPPPPATGSTGGVNGAGGSSQASTPQPVGYSSSAVELSAVTAGGPAVPQQQRDGSSSGGSSGWSHSFDGAGGGHSDSLVALRPDIYGYAQPHQMLPYGASSYQ
uniref:Bzip protein n=1 Tax=Macrostomum lignano TaxID=282301 RepID=A0A1I8IX69_9PLAT